MVAIIIVCVFIIFFVQVLPHLLYGIVRFFENLLYYMLSAAFGAIKLMFKLLAVFLLFGTVKFIFKIGKTGK